MRTNPKKNGIFWHTGEGQIGNMQMVRNNAAMANHNPNKKLIILFEYADSGSVRFTGKVEHLGRHA